MTQAFTSFLHYAHWHTVIFFWVCQKQAKGASLQGTETRLGVRHIVGAVWAILWPMGDVLAFIFKACNISPLQTGEIVLCSCMLF